MEGSSHLGSCASGPASATRRKQSENPCFLTGVSQCPAVRKSGSRSFYEGTNRTFGRASSGQSEDHCLGLLEQIWHFESMDRIKIIRFWSEQKLRCCCVCSVVQDSTVFMPPQKR